MPTTIPLNRVAKGTRIEGTYLYPENKIRGTVDARVRQHSINHQTYEVSVRLDEPTFIRTGNPGEGRVTESVLLYLYWDGSRAASFNTGDDSITAILEDPR